MHFSLAILSSIGLAAVCNAAALPVPAPATDDSDAGAFDNLDDLLPTPIQIDPNSAGFKGATQAKPPVEVVVTTGSLLQAGGNATDAPPSGAAPPIPAGNGTTNEARDVHGVDNRYLEPRMIYPYIAMGRIRIAWGNQWSWCSGSLVGGRVVLMARHCLKTGASYTFSPAYYNGNRFPTAAVTRVIRLPGTIQSGCDYKDDWALLIINRNMAATNGYLGFKTFTNSLANRDIFHNYGYPQDKSPTGQLPYSQTPFRAWRSTGCANGGPLLHLGDSYPGQSGSPVWLPEAQGHYQYGVHVASNSARGLMAHGPALINAIIAARRDYP